MLMKAPCLHWKRIGRRSACKQVGALNTAQDHQMQQLQLQCTPPSNSSVVDGTLSPAVVVLENDDTNGSFTRISMQHNGNISPILDLFVIRCQVLLLLQLLKPQHQLLLVN